MRKQIIVMKAGGGASVEDVIVLPGETVLQLIEAVAPKLYPEAGSDAIFTLLGPDGTAIPENKDIHAAVEDGDTVTLEFQGSGGE